MLNSLILMNRQSPILSLTLAQGDLKLTQRPSASRL